MHCTAQTADTTYTSQRAIVNVLGVVTSPHDVVTAEGGVGQLVCSIQGDGVQQLEWMRVSDNEVVEGDVETHTVAHITTSVLSTGSADSYYCAATFNNGLKVESSRASLVQTSNI